MSDFSQRIADLQFRLLNRFGVDGQISSSRTDFDTATNRMVSLNGQSRTVRVCPGKIDTVTTDGKPSQSSTVRIAAVQPVPGDTIAANGVKWTVVKVRTLVATDQRIIHIAEVIA